LTEAGANWIEKRAEGSIVPIDTSRFGKLIEGFKTQLGLGFYQRATEASNCYFNGTYLACCAMTGAAAESILLKVAIEKAGGDEATVLAEYRSNRGRSRIETRIVGQLDKRIADSFLEMLSLIKYWRDETAHGEFSDIDEFVAYEALARLLRFAHFTTDNWHRLTT